MHTVTLVRVFCKTGFCQVIIGKTFSRQITGEKNVVFCTVSADIENIDDGLESLCISVTEHALSGRFELNDCHVPSSFLRLEYTVQNCLAYLQ